MTQEDSNQELIQTIRRRLRLSMNGVVSTDMKLRGAGYTLNYGVGIPTLRTMATTLPHSLSTARALWNDKTRECRILATLTAPPEVFTAEELTQWLTLPLPNELAEQLAHNLLRHCANADTMVLTLLQKKMAPSSHYLAFLTIGKPLITRAELTPMQISTIVTQGIELIHSSPIYLNAVMSGWRKSNITPSTFDELCPKNLLTTDIKQHIREILDAE